MIYIGNTQVDAALSGNVVAVRGSVVLPINLTQIRVNGVMRRVLKVSRSPYVPTITLLQLEPLNG